MKRTKFFCATLISVFALFAFFSCSNPANSGTPSSHAKARGAKIVNVTYDANGGGQLSKAVYDYALGTTPDNDMPIAKKAGYRFKSWNTKADGSGEVFDKDFVIVDSIKVYAQWEFYATPFIINLNYSKAEEDGVTFVNANSMSSTATVAMKDTNLTIETTPIINEGATRDLIGFYDSNNVQVADAGGNLRSNTPYTNSLGQWIYDYDFYGLSDQNRLELYPRWTESIKATSVSVDYSTYNVELGQTFTITGTYAPANATTFIFLSDSTQNRVFTIGNVALIQNSLECNNGTFSLQAKVVALGNATCYFRCEYDYSISTSFDVRVSLPTDPAYLSSLPTLNAVNNSIPGYSYIGTSASTNKEDYTMHYVTANDKAFIHKVYLQANKTYYFEFADSDSSSAKPANINSFVDGYFYLYNSSGNVDLSFDYGGNNKGKFYRPTVSGDYYIQMRRYGISDDYTGYFGCHVFLDCITEIGIQPQNYYDQDRYNYSTGTYSFKPFESLDFDVVYTPYNSISSPTVWLDATVSNTDIVALDDTYIDPADGKYITLTANKTGITDIVIQDDYSGFGIHYFLEVMTDGVMTPTDTVGSIDYDDYEEMLFDDGLNATKWYKLALTGGHRYNFESGKYVTQIYDAIGSEDFTDIYMDVYDSDFNCLALDVHEFPCLTTGNYYVCFTPANTNKKNAFHIYDMGEINTSIALSSETLKIPAGGYTDITLTFNNGDPVVSSNFICSLDDNNQDDDTGETRFVTVGPYKSSPGDITVNGVSNGQFTFTGEPSKIRINGIVPGTTKLIFTDENAQITKEVNISVTQSALDGTLDLKPGAASSTTSNLADFYNEEFSDAKLYTVYSVSLLEGVTYYFQSLDEDNGYYFAEDLIDAHFYLEDSNNNIVAFNDSNQTTAYNCTSTGTYYFVCTYRNINSAASYTGYAGVRWFAEKITLGELTSPWVVTAGSSADLPIPYTPSDGYYDDLFVATFDGSRIISNATVPPGSKFVNVQAIAPGSATIEIEDDYTSTARQYPVTIVPPANKVIPVTISTSAPTYVSDISAEQNVQIADLYNNNYVIYSIDMEKGATYNIITADSDKTHGLSNLDDCYFYLEGPDFNIISSQNNFTSTSDNFYSYNCTESGTYYMLVVPRVSGTFGTTAGAVLVFVESISSLTAVSDMELPIFTSTAVNLSFTPSTAIYDFSVTSSNNRIKCTMNGPTLNIESLGIVQGNGYNKNIFPKSTVTVTDNISGESFSFIVQTSYDPANTITITPGIGDSSDPADYNITTVDSTKLVQIFKVELTGSMTYTIKLADVENNQGLNVDLEDSYLHIYDSNYVRRDYFDSGYTTYTPSGTGTFTYYLGLTSYYVQGTIGGVYIYSDE